MSKVTGFFLMVVACALAVEAVPRVASACGGCFSPQDTVTSVDSHRMVISLSAERTTLWDQIRYSGSPEDFVWVLPVPSGASSIELAEESFFEELEAQTAPIINAPPLPPLDCPPPPPDYGYGGGYAADGAAPLADAGGVTVYQEQTVGPYETVVIGSDSATALQDWLVAHGYRVPDITVPTIQYYVDRGSAFVVLRLSPGEGVSAMQPVKVRYPGYMATFPLKMVTVGASGVLDITLWVISDQRYETSPYATASIPDSSITWDWNTNTSNYRELFDAAIDAGGGRGFVAEYANPIWQLYFSSTTETDVASVGLKNPYVTRLRTHILVDHLGDDLELRPAAEVGNISNFHQVALENGLNPPVQQCPDWNGDGQPDTWLDWVNGDRSSNTCNVGRSMAAGPGAVAGLALLAGLVTLIVRRRRRRD